MVKILMAKSTSIFAIEDRKGGLGIRSFCLRITMPLKSSVKHWLAGTKRTLAQSLTIDSPQVRDRKRPTVETKEATLMHPSLD